MVKGKGKAGAEIPATHLAIKAGSPVPGLPPQAQEMELELHHLTKVGRRNGAYLRTVTIQESRARGGSTGHLIAINTSSTSKKKLTRVYNLRAELRTHGLEVVSRPNIAVSPHHPTVQRSSSII